MISRVLETLFNFDKVVHYLLMMGVACFDEGALGLWPSLCTNTFPGNFRRVHNLGNTSHIVFQKMAIF